MPYHSIRDRQVVFVGQPLSRAPTCDLRFGAGPEHAGARHRVAFGCDPNGLAAPQRVGLRLGSAVAKDQSRSGVEEAVADDLITALCLTDDMLSRLHDLACRCESCFGGGLDIEWAFAGGRLYLLQCRAMTRNR